MARKKKNTKKRIGGGLGIGGALVAVILVALYLIFPQWFGGEEKPNDQPGDTSVDGQVTVHVIDVGQADSILIMTPSGNMLIDAGANSSEEALTSYLESVGVNAFEYVIFTHPDADHIGGADRVMREYAVKNVILPNCVKTTKVYENMITAIEESKANVIEPVSGTYYQIGDFSFRILAPNSEKYSSTNDYSVVVRATYGAVSMMFTGDAEGNKEGVSEKEILKAYSPDELKSDFLKVGHHGSDTSSSEAFIRAVAPKIAAISVGEGNTYGHPVQSTLDTLQKAGVTVYRTDRMGTLLFVCDGKNITYQK